MNNIFKKAITTFLLLVCGSDNIIKASNRLPDRNTSHPDYDIIYKYQELLGQPPRIIEHKVAKIRPAQQKSFAHVPSKNDLEFFDAIKKQNFATVFELLATRRVNPNCLNNRDETPFQAALLDLASPSILLAIISHGSTIDYRLTNRYGENCIMYATRKCHDQAPDAELLLKKLQENQ